MHTLRRAAHLAADGATPRLLSRLQRKRSLPQDLPPLLAGTAAPSNALSRAGAREYRVVSHVLGVGRSGKGVDLHVRHGNETGDADRGATMPAPAVRSRRVGVEHCRCRAPQTAAAEYGIADRLPHMPHQDERGVQHGLCIQVSMLHCIQRGSMAAQQSPPRAPRHRPRASRPAAAQSQTLAPLPRRSAPPPQTCHPAAGAPCL